ncbi:MAG: LLM class flavin-dependent oxidoreductase [Ilumatobacteraceae bacterium]
MWQADCAARARGVGADGGVRAPPPSGSRSALGSSTSGPATRPGSPRCSRRSTISRPGGCSLGLGAWWEPLATKVGVDRARPLTAMREVVTVLRALLANETVSFDGEFVHLDGVELDYVYQERRPKDVPIYIGATGMKMMELTGEIADGVVLNYLVSPEYNRTRDGAPRHRCRNAPAAASTTSTGRSSWSARSTRIARRRSTAPACSSRSTSASNRTS